jgi:predicted nucleic acid-binding protein
LTLYIDSSAWLKAYLSEPDSEVAVVLLRSDPVWVSAQHTYVEVRRAVDRDLAGQLHSDMRTQFEDDWARTEIIGIDETIARRAADLAAQTGARTLDALHLSAAERTRRDDTRFLTFDRRQAAAARSLGWTVLGV